MRSVRATIRFLALVFAGCLFFGANPVKAASPLLVYEGQEGPGKGKHIVLVSGDDEYRSEESLPQLAKILAFQHGFKCTVLFAINPQTGEIDPATMDNIPGLEQLKTADLMIMFLRFRDLPDEQMKQILDYTNAGKPIIALRTSTHAFNFVKHKTYARWSWQNNGGFGRAVFGETWIAHYGDHQKESTRGLIAPDMVNHPIVQGCQDIWGPSDVYALTTLNGDCQPLILGQVLSGMNPSDKPNPNKKPLPVAWIKTYPGDQGKTSRIFTTTMGHVEDLKSEGFRRLLVNAAY
ncbi:MAG TPA: ThuA domain-containing protein, partial [Tepidisphaeraceae bacterium]|nr:ThuA domain-containing protein [Tepidisphaeraceae bacterium]